MSDRETALAAARKELRAAEFLRAFDIANEALRDAPGDEELAHVACLALARSGATRQANELFDRHDLQRFNTEEITSLRARLSKDAVLAAGTPAASPDLPISIDAYEQGYGIDKGYYPAINVAFLHLVGGNRSASADWAQRALDATGDEESYYAEATRAEALLLLGRTDEAATAIQRSAELSAGATGERSTTWKQLKMVCRLLSLDPAILAPLKPAPVAHFCGHIISDAGKEGRFPADQEPAVAAELSRWFAQHQCGRVFGSLAAGADILAAEAALAAGAELVAVLPFNADEFIQVSVASSGGDWIDRFEACLARASDVHFVTPDAWLGDNALFGYATQYAIGLARQHADWLDTDALQVVVWDREDGPNPSAGTAHDHALGAAADFLQTVIPVRSTVRPAASSGNGTTERPASPPPLQRSPRTMIFGDLKGFSKLTDAQMPTYVRTVLGAMADTLERTGTRPLFRNTWGDGIYLVFDDLTAAATCGFALQDAIREAVTGTDDIPDTLGLRLGIHYGPVYQIEDPVMRSDNFFGSHVSHAARTEPKTPEGEIYVTAQTAAAIALECRKQFRCEYVGRIPLAKNYGEFPMYHLRKTGP